MTREDRLYQGLLSLRGILRRRVEERREAGKRETSGKRAEVCFIQAETYEHADKLVSEILDADAREREPTDAEIEELTRLGEQATQDKLDLLAGLHGPGF